MSGNRDDSGVTLVEVLVATTIIGLLGAVIAAAFAVGVRETRSSSKRLSESQAAQIAASFFPPDVQSAATIMLGGAACTGTTAPIARLQWVDVDAANTSLTNTACYVVEPSTGGQNLVRQHQVGASGWTRVVVAYNATAASVACSTSCATPTTATLTVTSGDYTIAVAGSRRIS
jgi:prepilin-type N-terminal cleavage/methylation domain-containing protein